MSEDPLRNETAVTVSLEDTGLTAKAKSRAVSAVDRFCGNLVDLLNPKLERRAAVERARTEAELRVIDAATNAAVARFEADPEFAQRAIENHLTGIFREQRNKEAVAMEACEQLKLMPPSASESEQGEENLEEAFLNRVEHYAKSATTDELRQRWGRVLASEVRAPGTFSPRVLRAIDELSSDTAQLFERFCENRIAQIVPKCISVELSYSDQLKLVEAGLMVDPTSGQTTKLSTITKSYENEGEEKEIREYWFFHIGTMGITLFKGFPLATYKGARYVGLQHPFAGLQEKEDELELPIYVLTEVGRSIAKILPDTEEASVVRLYKWISENYDVSEINVVKQRDGEDGLWRDWDVERGDWVKS